MATPGHSAARPDNIYDDRLARRAAERPQERSLSSPQRARHARLERQEAATTPENL